ncbi:amidohydrolase [Agilicoccus flavus]|uniref:amidohydrolase n=1 Tax=Agilicoccus flavus TaxID=2775968 RepID=UPI001CF6E0E1|nr:amidohydrolase [Agilicoccus flavus]
MTIRVFRHGRIHTGAAERPAEAFAVRAGQILAVGSEAQVRRAVGTGAEVVDLEGAAVIPGIADAHLHSGLLSRGLVSVDLRTATSSAECARRLADHVAGWPSTRWAFGGLWDANLWAAGDVPHRDVLDAVCPERSVALISGDCHSMWVNSAALARLGIDAATPDPPGGQIVRDDAGRATGLLLEAARHPVEAIEGSDAGGDLRELLRRGQEHLLSLGLTSVTCFDGEDVREAYLDLHRAGELRLRVRKSIPAAALESAVAEGRRTGDGDDWFRTGAVKIFTDGALGSHTCHMSHEFDGEPGNAGMCVTPPAELDRLVGLACSNGIAVAAHAIGDRAISDVLDAFERSRETWWRRLRHRIEHVQHVDPADLPRMAALGVVASMQPAHAPSDIDLVESLLAGRGLLSYAWNSVRAAGIALTFGSDAPVETADPFEGLGAAVLRTRADGTPAGGWQPHERLTMRQALHAYTTSPADPMGEGRVGAIAPGRLADVVVLDRDPFGEAPESVRSTRVLQTWVAGECRYERRT